MIISMRDANDNFTTDLLGEKKRGRKPTGRAMSATQRSKQFRNRNLMVKVDKKDFIDGYRVGLEGGSKSDDVPSDFFSWRMGWLVANNLLPRTEKIDEMLSEMKNDL